MTPDIEVARQEPGNSLELGNPLEALLQSWAAP